jgi:DNA/RNA-binding domain of Phe-tRNA-synthetase-like protein
MTIHYTISNDIFAKFPGYCRGVVVARHLSNSLSPEELVSALRAAEHLLGERLSPESLTSHPQIESWREAYRSGGIKPSEFRPSVEALARRVLKGDTLPLISTLVDLGTLLSIRHLLPVGAHALDFVRQDIALRLATGEEVFEPFGSEVIEHPNPGEIIFAEGNTVLTRRWTWRQAKHTLVVPETRCVEINVDGLPPVTQAQVEQICQEAAELVQRYCGGVARYEVLSEEKPVIVIDE